MPARIPAAKLTSVQPTDAEIAEARRILAEGGEKGKRSRIGCMTNFLKSNPDAAAMNATGSDRDKFLEAFIVHQMRTKNAAKHVVNEEVVENVAQKHQDVYWWNAWKMDQEMGPVKAKGWRECGLLKPRPDSLTKSTHEDCIEFPVPVQWQRMTETDIKRMMARTEDDATNDDLADLRSASSGVAATTGATGVKIEPKTPLQLLQERCQTLKDNIQATLRKYQDIKIDFSVLEKNAETQKNKSKFVSMLIEDLKKATANVSKIIKICEKILQGDEVEDKELPKLLDSMEAMDKKVTELHDWATRFGLHTVKKRRVSNKSSGSKD